MAIPTQRDERIESVESISGSLFRFSYPIFRQRSSLVLTVAFSLLAEESGNNRPLSHYKTCSAIIRQNTYLNTKTRHTRSRVHRIAMEPEFWRIRSLNLCVGPQPGVKTTMAQLAQGNLLDLTHPLPGQIETHSNLIER